MRPLPRTGVLARAAGGAVRGATAAARHLPTGASRVLAVTAALAAVGTLPWWSGRDPALSVLRARSAEQEPTPAALAAVREQLGLDDGPLGLLRVWAGGVVRGDLGTSWVSGAPVGPGTLDALAVSLTLVGFAALVALGVVAALVAPSVRAAVRGGGARGGGTARGSGAAAAALTALPEFLLASALLVVVAVWWGLLPTSGWDGPAHAVLPALALGVPAGGLVGRLVADAVVTSAAEPWVGTWCAAGASRTRLAGAVLRRALPGVVPQVGLVLVGLTGGAVAVERVFAVPGLGRAALGAAQAQDVPALQAAVLVLLALGLGLGVAAEGVRRLLLGPAGLPSRGSGGAGGRGGRVRGGPVRGGPVRGGVDLPVPAPAPPLRRRHLLVPAVSGGVLAALVVAGAGRDALTPAHARLAPPSWALPLGADASGRDLLARLGQGAATTAATALAVCAACLVVGVAVGLLGRWGRGPVEVAGAAPPVLAGMFVAAVAGPTPLGAAAAVTAVAWAPLAAHTAALVAEAARRPHVRVLATLGVGPGRVLVRHVLPPVLGPVTRHALLRLPGTALALTSLGLLGLGPQPPRPDWGLVLAEGLPYAERAPWAVLGPALSLVALSVLAVSLSGLGRRARRRRRAGPGGTGDLRPRARRPGGAGARGPRAVRGSSSAVPVSSSAAVRPTGSARGSAPVR